VRACVHTLTSPKLPLRSAPPPPNSMSPQFSLGAVRGLVDGQCPFIRGETLRVQHWALLASTLTALGQLLDTPRDATQTKWVLWVLWVSGDGSQRGGGEALHHANRLFAMRKGPPSEMVLPPPPMSLLIVVPGPCKPCCGRRTCWTRCVPCCDFPLRTPPLSSAS
jgi:hypothetical protein